MYQVPAAIWNQIAASKWVANRSFRKLMLLTDEQLLDALNKQAELLEENGVPNGVIVSYQTMAPLLAENVAISRFINRTGNFALRNALPEVLTAREAVMLASRDRMLTDGEQRQLLNLLLPLELDNLFDDIIDSALEPACAADAPDHFH